MDMECADLEGNRGHALIYPSRLSFTGLEQNGCHVINDRNVGA